MLFFGANFSPLAKFRPSATERNFAQVLSVVEVISNPVGFANFANFSVSHLDTCFASCYNHPNLAASITDAACHQTFPGLALLGMEPTLRCVSNGRFNQGTGTPAD
jgi:hypothetical protein